MNQLLRLIIAQADRSDRGGFNFEEQSYTSFEAYAEHCISNNYGSKVA